jgi:hypothetical protein
MRAFFTAYGWPMPAPLDIKQRLKLSTLLDRFSPLRLPHKDMIVRYPHAIFDGKLQM